MSVDVDRTQLNTWVSPELRDRVDEEATRRGLSRSAYARWLFSETLGVPLTRSYSRRSGTGDGE